MSIVAVITAILLGLCMIAFIGCVLQGKFSIHAVAISYGTIAILLAALAIIIGLSGPTDSAETDMNGLLLLAAGFLVLFGAFRGIADIRAPKLDELTQKPLVGNPPSK